MHLWFDDVGSECMPTFSAFITSVGDVGNSSWLAAVWPSSISSLPCMPWRQKTIGDDVLVGSDHTSDIQDSFTSSSFLHLYLSETH